MKYRGNQFSNFKSNKAPFDRHGFPIRRSVYVCPKNNSSNAIITLWLREKNYSIFTTCVIANVKSNEWNERINIELTIVLPLTRMKRAGKQSAITWLVRQTLYHSWSYNISFSVGRFSSSPWHTTNSFHSMLHHSRRHICHFCLLLFSASAASNMRLAPFQSLAHLASNLSDFCCYLYFVHWTKLCLSSILRSFIFPSCHSYFSFVLDGRISRYLHVSIEFFPSFRISSSDNPPNVRHDTAGQQDRLMLWLKRFKTIKWSR